MRIRVFVLVLMCLIGGSVFYLFGQEKTPAYYNQHPTEILPDARESFQKGEYEKTISLCKLHYIIIGDSAADALRSRAEQCLRLSKEIKERASELLFTNPNDPVASILVSSGQEGESRGISKPNEDNPGESFPDDPTSQKKANAIQESVVDDSINGFQWVDLGLPSGIKWASANIGAEDSSDTGSYFSWGEVVTKKRYSTFDSSVDGLYTLRKEMDDLLGLNRLSPKRDAATVNWGIPWRTPDDRDWNELIAYCNWTWTVLNGHTGYLVVSPKNGNSIFLPASGGLGFRKGSSIGMSGFYWSSTLQKNSPQKANCLHFDEIQVNLTQYPSSIGCSIRPVSD